MRRTLNRGLRRSLGKLLPALTSCARPRRDGVECCYNLSGESRPAEIISISRVTCNHIIDAPVGRCVCSNISGAGLCFQALPHANAGATSTALWPSARFEALEHSRPYHLVTRAVNLTNFERTTVHYVLFCLNLHQNRDINILGDEDTGGGVMRREHAANSRGCQISLKVLVLVLSRARQGCSTSHIPANIGATKVASDCWAELPLQSGFLCIASGEIFWQAICEAATYAPDANPTRITPGNKIVYDMQT